ncbi:MAG: hypothetical protein K0U98_01195 [Deltaproteobacteria bacterium]|nr:hypothetical protein [Deltaproteobacteria bacterium]
MMSYSRRSAISSSTLFSRTAFFGTVFLSTVFLRTVSRSAVIRNTALFVLISLPMVAFAQQNNHCGVPVDGDGNPTDDEGFVSVVALGTDDVNDKQQGFFTDDVTTGGGGFDLHPLTSGNDIITDFDPAMDLLDVGDFARLSDDFGTLRSLEDIASLSSQTTVDGQTALVIDVDGPLGNSTTTLLGITIDHLNSNNVFFGLGGTSIPPQPVSWSSAKCVTLNTGCRFTIPGHEVPGSNGQGPANAPDPCQIGGGGPTGGDDALLLNENRFRIEANWRNLRGETGVGKPIQLTDDTGYFWFFNSTNVEMVIKVLDACEDFNRFWIFAAGLTNVEVDVRVIDTETGEIFTFQNPLGTAFQPLQATDAFATC